MQQRQDIAEEKWISLKPQIKEAINFRRTYFYYISYFIAKCRSNSPNAHAICHKYVLSQLLQRLKRSKLSKQEELCNLVNEKRY